MLANFCDFLIFHHVFLIPLAMLRAGSQSFLWQDYCIYDVRKMQIEKKENYIHGHRRLRRVTPRFPQGVKGVKNYFNVKPRKTTNLYDPFIPPGTIMYLDENFLCKNALKVKFTRSLFDPLQKNVAA